MRAVVRRVAELFPTAIISGRGREKVEGFVQLRELYYAGSHGMDIVGPQVCKRCRLLRCNLSFSVRVCSRGMGAMWPHVRWPQPLSVGLGLASDSC